MWGSVGTGTKEMSQVLGAFGLLVFTMLWPVVAHFEAYETFISLIFQILWGGRSKPPITETMETESADMGSACNYELYYQQLKIISNYNYNQYN